jgi:type VI secretion system ImpM family protein
MSSLDPAGTPEAGEPRAPGWYGKLPALGDFASRRLPARFVTSWDRWLAQGLASSRERLGDAWLDAYLTSPVWRFFLMPGALASADNDSEACWSGVVMPSVDSVGRYFPLTIAAPFKAAPVRSDALADLWRWLGEIERIALAVLRFDQPVAWLEAQLALRSPPDGRPVHGSLYRGALLDELSIWAALAPCAHGADSRPDLLPDSPPDLLPGPAAAHALWVAPGLPDAELFVAMLTDGRP